MGGERYNPFGNNQDLNGLFEPKEEQVVSCVLEKKEETIEKEEYDLIETPVMPTVKKKELSNTKKDKNKLNHSVKFLTDEEEDRFQQILAARGTNDSDALRWCVKEAYLKNKKRIDRIAMERRNMETL